VRVHEPSLVEDKCNCSREKIVDVLKSLPPDELEESWQDGEIITSCEFCSTVYTVKPGDLD